MPPAGGGGRPHSSPAAGPADCRGCQCEERSWQSLQRLPQGGRCFCAVRGSRAAELPASGVIRPFHGEPNRLQSLWILAVAREQMPVEMGFLIAKQLVIELAGPKTHFNGLGHPAHVVQIAAPFHIAELAKLSGVSARHDDAVAVIVLPGSQEHDGVGQLCYQFIGRHGFEVGQLATEGALGGTHEPSSSWCWCSAQASRPATAASSGGSSSCQSGSPTGTRCGRAGASAGGNRCWKSPRIISANSAGPRPPAPLELATPVSVAVWRARQTARRASK